MSSPCCNCKDYMPEYTCIDELNCVLPKQWDIWISLPDAAARRRFSPDQMPVYDYDKAELDRKARESLHDEYQLNAGKNCSFPGCPDDAEVKGLCRTHYRVVAHREAAGKTGAALYVPVRPYAKCTPEGTKCTFQNCDGEYYADNLCKKHYATVYKRKVSNWPEKCIMCPVHRPLKDKARCADVNGCPGGND